MNPYKIEAFKDCKVNIITIIQEYLPENVFSDFAFNSYDQANIEFLSKYADRKVSSYMDYLISFYAIEIDRVYQGLSEQGILYLKTTIGDRFKSKWKKLNDLWNMEYNPLQPFDITLHEDYKDTLEVLKDKSKSSSQDNIYGFNSVDSIPSDDTANITENEYKRENPHTRDYNRKGNIGNTSYQELIKQERDVLKFQIIDVIYKDIATVVCRGKYI